MISNRVAIAGVGNRAHYLIQGQEFYKTRHTDAFAGLMPARIGDEDRRKVIAGTDLGGGGIDV